MTTENRFMSDKRGTQGRPNQAPPGGLDQTHKLSPASQRQASSAGALPFDATQPPGKGAAAGLEGTLVVRPGAADRSALPFAAPPVAPRPTERTDASGALSPQEMRGLARLLEELTTTSDAGIERFRQRRAKGHAALTADELKRARDLLVALALLLHEPDDGQRRALVLASDLLRPPAR